MAICPTCGHRIREARAPKPQEPKRNNRLDLIPEPLRSAVVEQCRAVCSQFLPGDSRAQPCVESNHACHRCQDLAAAEIARLSPSQAGGGR